LDDFRNNPLAIDVNNCQSPLLFLIIE